MFLVLTITTFTILIFFNSIDHKILSVLTLWTPPPKPFSSNQQIESLLCLCKRKLYWLPPKHTQVPFKSLLAIMNSSWHRNSLLTDLMAGPSSVTNTAYWQHNVTASRTLKKKKWNDFDIKSWVTGWTKIQPGIQSNWRIFESIWLSRSSQFYSNILQLLGIPGRILVPPVTQLFRSKWFHFFLQCIVVIRSAMNFWIQFQKCLRFEFFMIALKIIFKRVESFYHLRLLFSFPDH